MRSILLVAGTAGLIGLIAACGGDDRAKALSDGGSSNGGRGGTKPRPDPSDGGENVGGAGDVVDSLAPVVKITSPVAVSDPNEGEILSGDAATVRCQARSSTAPGAAKVNPAKVTLKLLSADGEVLSEKPGLPTDSADEYANEFPLAGVAAGVVGFTCRAEADDERSGSDDVETFFDKGPTVTFVTPESDEAHALKEPLAIEFRVEPARLTDDDEAAAVKSVALDLGGQAIDLSDAEDREEPGLYRVRVDLDDRTVFDPAPSGPLPITVVATNSRAPRNVAAVVTRSVAVDGEGPTLQITSPAEHAIVGGKVRLAIKANDPISRVDPATLLVTLNSSGTYFKPDDDRWSVKDDVFTFEFDSRQQTSAKLQITVNVSAKDMVGNESLPASLLLYIDNHPPIVDLDPGNIRRTPNLQAPFTCSASFDPVGPGSTDDLDVIPVVGRFRALILDQTNTAEGSTERHYAEPDPDTARLYVEPGTPLLKDGNGDKVCDEIVDTDSARSIELRPIKPNGYAPGGQDDATAPTAGSLGCTTVDGGQAPNLCDGMSDMTYVVEHQFVGAPAVYGVSPTADGQGCTGGEWEFTAKVSAAQLEASAGWVCLAARVVDQAGNVGVSRPIRVCVDDPETEGAPPCATMSIAPPSCTDNCTPPSRFGNYLWHDLY